MTTPEILHEPDATLLRIKLPLPMSVVAALMSGVGTMWPDATIVTDKEVGGFGPSFMTFRLPKTAPAEPAEAATPVEMDEVLDAWIHGFRPGGVVLEPSEAFGSWLAMHFWDVLTANPEAINYVQMGVFDPKNGRQLNVLILNPDGKTPHELCMEADARVARLEEQLRAAGLEPAS